MVKDRGARSTKAPDVDAVDLGAPALARRLAVVGGVRGRNQRFQLGNVDPARDIES